MDLVRLGRTGPIVSRLGLGAWLYGHDSWSNVDDDLSMRTLRAALDAGITLVDTAPAYGGGYSETIVGKAIKGRRDRVCIATKCHADPAGLPRQIEESLRRLGVDCIDLYQLHYPSAKVPVPDIIGAMSDLQSEGKVRYIGVCNFSRRQLEEAVATAEIVSCQSPYNLLWREIEAEGVSDFCREHGIGILPYSPLAQGLLTGKFRKREDIPNTQEEARVRNVLFREGVFERALEVVAMLDEISARYGKTISQTALNWVTGRDGTACAIPGARDMRQLEENLGSVGWELTPKDAGALDEAGKRVASMLDYSANMWGNKYAR